MVGGPLTKIKRRDLIGGRIRVSCLMTELMHTLHIGEVSESTLGGSDCETELIKTLPNTDSPQRREHRKFLECGDFIYRSGGSALS